MMVKPNMKKKNGKFIVSCPLCDMNFIASNENQAEYNFNNHYMHKHENWEDEE